MNIQNDNELQIYDEVYEKFNSSSNLLYVLFNKEEKDFVIKRCINHEFYCFPESFNIERLEENNLDEDGAGFVIEETLDCVRVDIEEETQIEFQEFLKENGSYIAEQALYEYAKTNAIVALDQNGNVIKEFYSFDEIATYFNVYNLILLPWMIKNCFTKDSERLVKLACVICYCIYFYYQIVITWNLGYVSDILGLNF